MTFTSIAALKAEINRRIDFSLKHSIAPIVKDAWSQSASSIAHSVSLANTATMVDSVGGGELLVENHAKPEPSVFSTPIRDATPDLFAGWVERGTWMELSDYLLTGNKTKRPERQFTTHARKTLNGVKKLQIMAALKNDIN